MNRSSDTDVSIPVVVDLDGTLTPVDTLHEAIVRYLLRGHVIAFLNMCIWLLKGKPFFKNQMALLQPIDLSLIPWNDDVIAYIRDQKKNGRTIILCTASNQLVAKKVCDYFKEFDAAFGSNSTHNLNGVNKRNFLDQKFGKGNYEYIGNSYSDLLVWKHSSFAVIKSTNRSLQPKVEALGIPMRSMSVNYSLSQVFTKQLRLHQWVKNLLIFVPLIAAHEYGDFQKGTAAIAAFLTFGLLASGTYIINDIIDIDADRSHPEKKYRPIAAGSIPIIYGLLASLILLISAISIAFSISANFAYVLLGYLIYSIMYSVYFKSAIIIDIISLGILFTVRIVAGMAACALVISPLLLIFSFFIFLSLAGMKRYTELKKKNESSDHDRRSYHADDKLPVMIIGFTSAYTSVAIFAIYLLSEASQEYFSGTFPIVLTIPVLVYWLSYMWMKAVKFQLHHDPVVVALKDKTSLIAGFIFVFIFIISSYL